MAVDVTFRNTAGPEKHQAVALRNNAEGSSFYRCSFEGYQDTLYVHSLRQFYRECDIYGNISFVLASFYILIYNCWNKIFKTRLNLITVELFLSS